MSHRAELVPVERARRDGHPVRALRDIARAALASSAGALIAGWRRDWGVTQEADPAPLISCVHAWEVPSGLSVQERVWRRLATEEQAGAIWLGLQSGDSRRSASTGSVALLDAVQTLLFGGCGAANGLSKSAAGAAWTDWCHRLARQCGMTGSVQQEVAIADERQALPDLFTHRWTGAVLLRLAIGEQVLWLALDADAVDGWLKASGFEQALPASGGTAPLTPLPVALRDAAVDVRVELRTVDVALGDLMTLALGDVIQTQHAIDSPMQILVGTTGGASATPLCHAYLGMRDGARAVVLAKSGP